MRRLSQMLGRFLTTNPGSAKVNENPRPPSDTKAVQFFCHSVNGDGGEGPECETPPLMGRSPTSAAADSKA